MSAFTDTVYYRKRTKSTAIWDPDWTVWQSPASSPIGLTLPTGYEYEFKIERTNGAQTKVSAAKGISNSVNLTNGGSITSTGTFTVTGSNGQSDVTYTRTKGNSNSLNVSFTSANWDWVGISYGFPVVRYCASNDNSPPATETDGTNTYNRDATKIERVDNKTVDVKLASSVTFRLIIRYNGNSSGSIIINGL